jgi:transposase, IS30 family
MSDVQLGSEARYVIYHLKLYRLSLREIGRRLGRSHSTISRELKRNGPIISSWVYWHPGAHEQALQRRKQPRHYRRRAHAPLVCYVEQSLRAEWSPDVIAAKLKMDYPNDIRMRVSIETVYRWVCRDANQGGQLLNCLCRCHKKRRRQHRYGTGRDLIPGRASIHLRPDPVATRQRFGDWEGDTVEGALAVALLAGLVRLTVGAVFVIPTSTTAPVKALLVSTLSGWLLSLSAIAPKLVSDTYLAD